MMCGALGCGFTGSFIFSQTIFTGRAGVLSRVNGAGECLTQHLACTVQAGQGGRGRASAVAGLAVSSWCGTNAVEFAHTTEVKRSLLANRRSGCRGHAAAIPLPLQ